jgi:enoyl-CoA hydratase/carnithine racemase
MLQRIEHPHGVLEVRLARPPANALDPALIRELGATFASPPRSARAVVLSGGAGIFSAGLDVPALLPLGREAILDAWRDFYALLRALASSPVPIAAAITGHSPAGGAVMALFCDTRIMAAGPFRIGLNEVQVGLPMPPALHRALVRLVGPHRAERMATGAAMLDPESARSWGFVDEVVAPERVVPRALEWCGGLLALPPEAMRATRAFARRDLVALFDGAEADLDPLLHVWFGDETRAAMRALVERLAAKKS